MRVRHIVKRANKNRDAHMEKLCREMNENTSLGVTQNSLHIGDGERQDVYVFLNIIHRNLPKNILSILKDS